jgi:lipopolysaccharide/colanic/teichoic acid biosynthesis glycosyltransferase
VKAEQCERFTVATANAWTSGLGGRSFRFYKFRTMTSERDTSGQLKPDAERITA